MTKDLQRVGDVAQELEAARQAAPSEIALSDDGRPAVIQWQGTPVTAMWLTGYVDRLIAAGLVKPYAGLTTTDERERAVLRKDNEERLAAWHRVLGGLPKELLEAARVRFERDGLPDGRWGYLNPTDVSKWVRARAKRRIPPGQECDTHPDELADTCRACADERKRARAQLPPGFMERLRAQMEADSE